MPVCGKGPWHLRQDRYAGISIPVWQQDDDRSIFVTIVQVQASHLLVKHTQSRRPSSWKQDKITRSKEEALEILKGRVYGNLMWECFSCLLENFLSDFRRRLESKEAKFAELASKESDCSSARKGGDLGAFGRGQMQSETHCIC